MPVFETISILGPGLLGASVMMAARDRGLCKRLTTWSRRKETRDECAAADWCDAVAATPAEAVQDADLVIICTPVDYILSTLEAAAPALRKGALVTDVGSTKGFICAQAQRFMPAGTFFIGSHPMAGSEKSGLKYARADLFEHRACLMTPTATSSSQATATLHTFWQALGMLVYQLTPQEHDTAVAHISHLPHLLASTLCAYLAEMPQTWSSFAGAGLRDTTRIAAGDPVLWEAIFSHNREAVLAAVDGFQQHLNHFRQALTALPPVDQPPADPAAANTLHTLLEQGKTYRDHLSIP